ncbi:uncharacterized protein RHOBADRAFT_55183 [Rhodotorula graminis WP1]|uniref:GDP-fucose protein O-fucosyltransferase 2 n=1 Tax=Rhodotorula graminis (strain WP1) TaxID=578459 RepID=A0A0N8PZW3_RHOGW|nr:uncharacterized protein RHOBADRAFT_55183 [Rhodotorula graminis WP1]KPV73445.1 hypothetical protein RHOBADRAFT_55183 [Rhodotorula graminis WP1]
MSRRASVVPHNVNDEDVSVANSPKAHATPAIPQTPLISQLDRDQLDHPLPPPPAESRDSHHNRAYSASATKAAHKPVRRASRAGRSSSDWSRDSVGGAASAPGAPAVPGHAHKATSSRSFLPTGLFSSFTRSGRDAKGRYEPVGPMRAGKPAGEKSYVELDLDEYAEGLRLTVDGDDDEGGHGKGRQSSGVGAFFDQFYPPQVRRNRRLYERVAFVGVALTLFILLVTRTGSGKSGLVERAKVKGLGPKNPLKSNIPLHSFRANLKEGAGYVTSFPYGGLTNQLIELFKLVHVAQRLDRAAILTELKATHSEGGDVPLSDFFDLAPFAYYANVSMVQWHDVKIPDVTGTQSESLSCWGWGDERPLERYNVKTHFWPFPGQLQIPSSIETSITFPGIEVLASQDNSPWLRDTVEKKYGSLDKAPAFPDQQLLCFENLFYVQNVKFVKGTPDTTYAIEELRPDGPVWDKVGKFLRFNDHVNHVVDEFLGALLGSRRRKYVAVHLRQGDFVALGRAARASQEVAELYAEGVRKVQEQLKKRRGASKKDLPVLFATDSDDPVFINRLTRMGWIYLDHREFASASRYGGWWPGILDSAVLSRAQGFVGTKMSTFSYVAARRVESWQGGPTLIVG